MGMYPCKNAKVYGIQWFKLNIDNYDLQSEYTFCIIDKSELTKENKEIIFNAYNKLNDNHKNNLYIQMYIECWSSINPNNLETFISWYPISRQMLEDYLNI